MLLLVLNFDIRINSLKYNFIKLNNKYNKFIKLNLLKDETNIYYNGKSLIDYCMFVVLMKIAQIIN